MLLLLVFAFLIYTGIRCWPWWTPIAAWAIALPITALQLYSTSTWRAEADLPSHGLPAIALSLAIQCAAFILGYGIGRVCRWAWDAAFNKPA